MKKPAMHRIMRPIFTLFGAAIGGGLAALGVRIYLALNEGRYVETMTILWICLATTLLFALLSWLASRKMLARVERWCVMVVASLSDIPLWQILTGALGLVIGLVVAALVSQLFRAGLPELLWAGVSAVVYLMLGYLGATIGVKRWWELPAAYGVKLPGAERRAVPQRTGGADKILDSSVMIDGRIFDVCKTGFVEGPFVIPQFVLEELRHIADSSDSLRRSRGRRGLDVLARMQKELDIPVTVTDADFDGIEEVDVKLLKLAKATNATVVTNDFNLNKVADVTGVKVLNINDLAGALRPVLLPGEEMNVHILREGKEHGQGIGYLEDGTMIVVDSGKRYIGETVDVVVTTVLQTSAGRMIFTKMKQAA